MGLRSLVGGIAEGAILKGVFFCLSMLEMLPKKRLNTAHYLCDIFG
jgi:hypothetical protein